ncbi:MAG: GGDEF domain-containing protein [Erythrobacter sp.]
MSDQVLGLINPVMALIFALASFLIWRRDRSMTYLLGFVVASLIIGLSFLFNHYLFLPSATANRLAVNVLSMTAVATLLWSACTRLGQRAPVGVWAAGGVATISMISLTDPASDMTVWLFGLNFYCGVMFVMGTQILVFARSRELVDRVMIWIFSLLAIQFFARPVLVYAIDGAMTSAEYRASVGHAIFVVTGAIGKLMLAGVVIAAAMTDQFKAFKSTTQTDRLSGLTVRNAFEEDAQAMITRAATQDVPVSLIVADIDHFKQVNDVWGHPAGDKAITTFGKVFLRTIRPSDLAGRIGGEEFCVLAWDCTEGAAANLAERLRIQFAEERHEGLWPEISITSSFGVAAWKPGEAYARAYERADAALYRAKRAGRNRVVSNALGQIGEARDADKAKQQARNDVAESKAKREAKREAESAQIVAFADAQASLRDAG